MNGIRDKVALITGAGGYIGGAVAERLAREGARLVLADINETTLHHALAKLKGEGVEAIGQIVDVTSPQSIAQLIQAALQKFGSLDIQVNIAGGSSRIAGREARYCHLVEQEDYVIDAVLKVNLYGALYVSRAVARQMIAAKRGGKIINFASTVGVNGLENCVEYAAAKGGVIAMTRALAKELGPHGINVNAVAPGIVMRPEESGGNERALNTNYLGRKCMAADIAGMVAYLVSSDADFVTGQTCIIDGGRSLGMKGSD